MTPRLTGDVAAAADGREGSREADQHHQLAVEHLVTRDFLPGYEARRGMRGSSRLAWRHKRQCPAGKSCWCPPCKSREVVCEEGA
jgi:hypothetical protein